MEVPASERDDFAIGRVIAGFDPEVTRLGGALAFPEIFQQQRFLVSRTQNEDCFAVLERLFDLLEEGRVIRRFTGADGIGLVMQMLGRRVRMNRQLISRIQAQKEDFGDEMVDPDDGVVMNSHGFLYG
ncbi:hypothetical protein [Bradyrhizobium sp. Ash2021]|uniref:hypothetical protein n=1 Tax=Bradyrhizobium sp. Ash2021 TaxID=2954771 RepID=UPI00281560EE|nr:hypothetical protein [Bradyrhizobium sp. Ash2021]WMT73443.1 hypothetical protein NL528_36700 [Bradyrhizobium sp. Ash2021]